MLKFLSTVGSHKPDESTMIKNRLSKKLDFAKELQEKIEVALDEPSTSLVKLKILSEDFCIIIKLYMEWSSVVRWNDSEFAFTQEVGFSLKERLANRLADEEHKNNLKLDESRALQKNLVQGRTLPKIDSKSWPRFLRIFRLEESNFKSELTKINVIRNSLKSQQDIVGLEGMSNVSDMLTWLHIKYGQISNVCSRSIEFLETTKVPGGGYLNTFILKP